MTALVVIPYFMSCLITGVTAVNNQYQSNSIPAHLIPCYKGGQHYMPLSLRTFIDLVKKIEVSDQLYSVSDVAGLLLHRYSFDGIERMPEAEPFAGHFIPYTVSGFQRVRSQLLKSYLLSGFATKYKEGTLSTLEECTLHFMLSSTIDPWERGDEHKVCPLLVRRQRTTPGGAVISVCPRELGIINVGDDRKQAVSISRFIAGILTILEPTDYIWNDRVMSAHLISTVSGDLAEVAVYQAASQGLQNKSIPWVGAAGTWNDTTVPDNYYLEEINPSFTSDRLWQYTDAEILGSIDGLLVGREMGRASMNKLSLSQIIDLYYNVELGKDYGISTAQNRDDFIPTLKEDTTLKHNIILQAKMFAQMLHWFSPALAIRQEKFDNIMESAYQELYFRTKKLNLGVQFKQRNPTLKTSLNVIFDSSFSQHEMLRILVKLSNGIDIWDRGSRLSVINGETGDALISDAVTVGDVWFGWFNATDLQREPVKMSLSTALIGLRKLLSKHRETACRLNDGLPVDSRSSMTLILDMANSLTDNEFRLSKSVLSDILVQYPEMNFTFVSKSKYDIPNLVDAKYLDRIHLIDPYNIMNKVLGEISSLEMVITPGPCCGASDDGYIITEQDQALFPKFKYHYRIDASSFCKSSHPSLQIWNGNNGGLTVCVGNYKGSEESCKYIEIGNVDDWNLEYWKNTECLQDKSSSCPGIHISILANSTYADCIDILCRTPDMVKFTIQLSGFHCLTRINDNCPSLSTISKGFSYIFLITLSIFLLNI